MIKGVGRYLRGYSQEALSELEQAASLLTRPDAYLWSGLVYASLKRDEEARTALEKISTLTLPPILLETLTLLEQQRADFYQAVVIPLFAYDNQVG